VRKQRTYEEAREALQRLISGCWHHTHPRYTRACFTIPVDEERDADCILSDVIQEWQALKTAPEAEAGK